MDADFPYTCMQNLHTVNKISSCKRGLDLKSGILRTGDNYDWCLGILQKNKGTLNLRAHDLYQVENSKTWFSFFFFFCFQLYISNKGHAVLGIFLINFCDIKLP